MTYRLSHEYGDNSAFQKLLSIIETNKDNPDVLIQLAYRYEDIEEYQKAKDLFLETAKLYEKNDEKKKDGIMHCYERASLCLALDKDYPAAVELQITLYNNPKLQNQKDKILKTLARVSEMGNKIEDFFFYSEAYLDLNPIDTDLRFDLAYKYSQERQKGLASLHYKKILNIEEMPGVRNNLGVAYDELGLVSKSVECYMIAANNDESLAMANLANKYIKAGFLGDANNLIIRANSLALKNIEVHQNIGLAKMEIEKNLESENKKQDEISSKSEKDRKFRVRFGQSLPNIAQIDIKSIEGDWHSKNGIISIKIIDYNDFRFNAEGETILKKDSLLKTLIETETNQEFKELHKRIIKIDGKLSNLTGNFTINIQDVTEYENLTPKKEPIYKAIGYMLIDKSFKKIDIMEKTNDEKVEFDCWHKVQ